MRFRRTRTVALRVLPLVLVIGALSPVLLAWHWAKLGWGRYRK